MSFICDIYTAVAEIHNNVDLVFGLKNMYEVEAELSTRDSCYKFLNRSLPFFPNKLILKPKERKFIKIEVPFTDEISSLPIIKLLYRFEGSGNSNFKGKVY